MNPNKLIFFVHPDGDTAVWRAEGLPTRENGGGDFWRMMVDDGYYREMLIYSSQQAAKLVTTDDDKTVIVYDGLVGTDGRKFDIGLTLTVTRSEQGLLFDATVENHDTARVNELEYPFVDLETIGDEDCSKEILVRPKGLGERVENPRVALRKAHTEYMSADYLDIKSTLLYPRPAGMAFMGVESGGHFLYVGRHDPDARACCLLCALPPREEERDRFAMAICHYPFVKTGERVSVPQSVVSLSEGDFREGSARYRAFAERAYYRPLPKPEWVKNMHGWQRVILRHQYGEIFWRYEDLPRLYLEGKESGLDTLLVFGWWKGRFDNGYPHYEIDEELGGEAGLKAAIAEVKRLGGRVILYNNGILLDKQGDFFREYGAEVARIDIDGNQETDHYKFENNGTVLRNFGYKSFVRVCHGTERWKEVMLKNGKQKLSYGCDSIFYDQLGSSVKLCFNETHKHGARPDDEARYRMENIAACRALLNLDQAIGTECTCDYIAASVHYIHGCERGTWYKASESDSPKGICPALFLHTFPETVLTNRRLHDCRKGFRDELNFNFVHGLRFDVSIYRGRRIGIKGLPAYAEHIKKLNDLKDQYAAFFFGDGHFVYDTVPERNSDQVWFGEHVAGDRRLMTFANMGDKDATVRVWEKTLTVPAHDVLCVEK